MSKITSDDVINEEVLSSIQTFVESQNFKKATLTFIASRIPEECIENLRDAFIKIDWNGDGMLTEEELELGFKYMEGISIERDEISWIMQAMDTNKNGSLDYTEFIAGCMNSYIYTKGNNLKQAFEYFDKDRWGKITYDELMECLTDEDPMMTEEDVRKLINEADVDGDGAIDYSEFLEMMDKN